MIISLFLKLSISVYFQFYFLTKWKSPALGKNSNICFIFHREVENVILTKWPFNEKQAYKFSKSHPNVFVFEEFNLKIVEGQCFLSKLNFNCDNQSHHHHHYQRRMKWLRTYNIHTYIHTPFPLTDSAPSENVHLHYKKITWNGSNSTKNTH